jgi:uncharacterized repeat protein (TIGR04076 family)
MNAADDDGFDLWDLRVEVTAPEGARIWCGAERGDYFELRGEMLHLPPGQGFSIYSLAAVLPLLAAKQLEHRLGIGDAVHRVPVVGACRAGVRCRQGA